MRDHRDVLARRDDVVATVLAAGDDVEVAVRLLDAAEAALEVPLVDEAERARLRELTRDPNGRAQHWHPVLARRGDDPVGYAGVLLPMTAGGLATGDVAIDRTYQPSSPVLAALLASLERLASGHAAGHLEVWIRHVENADIRCATDEGYGVERRLAVLGRHLDVAVPQVDAPGLRIRPYRAGSDDHGVVDVLASAYAGTPDGGWDADRFAERRALPWFRAEDLLLAVDGDGALAGLHWLKRRGGGVGEVYNLAIHPDAQGRRAGAALLAAGLRHLVEVGCREVLLWVDLANERAVRLYASQGFRTRWEDVALGRTLRRD